MVKSGVGGYWQNRMFSGSLVPIYRGRIAEVLIRRVRVKMFLYIEVNWKCGSLVLWFLQRPVLKG